MTVAPKPGRTALCLCGGGITGAVYEVGVLLALSDYFVDFEMSQFDIYVGTSAGAFVATLMASGVRPQDIARAIAEGEGGLIPARRTDIYRADPKEVLAVARDVMTILGRSLARAARRRELSIAELGKDLEDALPAGIFSLEHYERWLKKTFAEKGVPLAFAQIPRELYITANDLDSGHRVVFGEDGYRDVPIPKAICASSAIPMFFEPVRIDGRDYVDGAVGKVGHLDVALRRGAELLIVVNPMVPVRHSADAELPSAILGARRLRDKGLLTVHDQARRMSVRTKLHSGIRRYRLQYPQAKILLIEPQEDDADMLLANPMNFRVRRRLLRYGYDSGARQLVERHHEFAAAFERHRIRANPSSLAARPWDRA